MSNGILGRKAQFCGVRKLAIFLTKTMANFLLKLLVDCLTYVVNIFGCFFFSLYHTWTVLRSFESDTCAVLVFALVTKDVSK